MGFNRGGGGGGGRYGGYSAGNHAKQEPFEVFPEIKETPVVNLKQIGENFRSLVSWGNELQKFWISSPYHLGNMGEDAKKNAGVFPMMTDEYFPAELVAGKVKHINKKIRWDPQSDLQRLDIFEKLDQGPQGQDAGDKEKNEDEDDDDEDNENFEKEEDDSGDDYIQNIDFDDDEDDFNPVEDHGDD
uniref:MATH and LRR domain-containing protein PFE0570w-like n=1 Tax=Erigeron canadensis TaxID=72917 RepID=UPI001CB8FDC0|nr:MATH and LRR domain-containing protein PFE0570w-like [Erigeron canadensis]XP_043613443.1 MATH and LRR domain-containing protein PFE0570w-like [Erigeron canadensis]XP_043613444.1 MATH and LRR domain-containing protein PFE0570w-like [Erigeron canadensis]